MANTKKSDSKTTACTSKKTEGARSCGSTTKSNKTNKTQSKKTGTTK